MVPSKTYLMIWGATIELKMKWKLMKYHKQAIIFFEELAWASIMSHRRNTKTECNTKSELKASRLLKDQSRCLKVTDQ